ncbi:PREDICTED: protocadherin Fat 4-like [Priapulus caudatus]|uniref:Protocadherin Fat 4-like n=1 Tax=Priapulus caudatus TaxID=37621 RepID=A0ABM1F1X5_PRICU|nr:PREDICTED: protocadherin Fat 4-like [Priapulus caudatus]
MNIYDSVTADDWPVFDETYYTGVAAQQENAAQELFTVRATTVGGATVAYTLRAADAAYDGYFSVEGATGVVSTVAGRPLDYAAAQWHHLVVTASAAGLSTDAVATVTVTRDASPVFAPPPSPLMVAASHPAGVVVYRAHATSHTGAPLLYSRVDPSSDEFAVDRDTGDVRTTVAPPLSLGAQTLTVLATEQGVGGLSARQTINIEVYDVAGNAPIFTTPAYSAEVPERAPPGYSVCVVKATAAAGAEVAYTIAADSPSRDDFAVDAASGVVTTTRMLDAPALLQLVIMATNLDVSAPTTTAVVGVVVMETATSGEAPVFAPVPDPVRVHVTWQQDATFYTVYATGSGKLQYVIDGGSTLYSLHGDTGELSTRRALQPTDVGTNYVTISATDADGLTADMTMSVEIYSGSLAYPEYTEPYYTAGVREGLPPGEHVVSVEASVPAESVEYDFTEASLSFHIDPNSGDIVTLVELSYDVQSLHYLTVRASVTGQPSLYTDVLVSVFVTSYQPPVFSPVAPLVRVADDVTAQTLVYTVYATHGGAPIRYSLRADAAMFAVDPTRGDVSTRVAPPLLIGDYVITVRAEDSLNSALYADVDLNVEVYNAAIVVEYPRFDQTIYDATVEEGGAAPQPVVTVRAATPGGDSVMYELNNEDAGYDGYFDMVENTGEITTLRTLDYNDMPLHTLTVTASNEVEPDLQDVTVVLVHVTEMVVPQFPCSQCRAEVWEDADVDSEFYTLTVTNANSFPNLVYAIEDDDSGGMFSLSNVAGEAVFSVAKPLQTGDYSLTVSATDGAASSLTSLSVRVNPANRPNFAAPSYNASILEVAPAGSYVADVWAVSPLGNLVTYRINKGNENDEQFEINADSGIVSLRKPLDREIYPWFYLNIVALDSAGSQVTFYVADINDNAPVFPEYNYTGFIWEGMSHGEQVLIVRAVWLLDREKRSADLAEENGFFPTPPTSPDPNSPLDREIQDEFSLEIVAEDNAGSGGHVTITYLVITIGDINDNAPVFDVAMETSYIISEADGVGTVVAKVVASDADAPLPSPNAVVRYYMLYGAEDQFQVDRITGDVYVSGALDRAAKPSYELLIAAYDCGAYQQLNDTITLTVDLTDVNNHAPYFAEATHAVSIVEGVAGVFVTKVTAVDLDDGLNLPLLYSIQDDVTADFVIDPADGTITTKRALRMSEQLAYNFSVYATDDTALWDMASMDVLVLLEESNLETPTFAADTDSVTLLEKLAVDTLVYVAWAEDGDVRR